MRYRVPATVLGAVFVLACGQDDVRETQPPIDADRPAIGVVDREVTGEVFVDAQSAGDQVVYVGEDRLAGASDRTDAVFVPLSTFSVETDGIPNEFPPPDSMVTLLEEAGVTGDRLVIVGEPIPAGRAYAGFDYLGLGDRVTVLDGGPGALGSEADTADAPETPANGPGAQDTAAEADTRSGSDRSRAELDIDVRDDMIVDAEWVHERLDDPDVAILDARPPDQFSGETPGDGIDRPGHIPGARNVFWQDLVRSEQDPRLKEEAELRRIFEEAGVDPDDTIVAYCRTGGQGSFLYTVARHLGYDVRLYDGSFVDWSRTDYEVER